MESQPASALLTPPPPGTRLGDFVLEEEIGRGGMGVVYRAWQESLQREVAVKLLRDSALAEPSLLERFRAEALAAAALQHPGIVRVHGSGEADGVFFYAMDYVEGRSLAEVVRDGGPLEPKRAAALAAEVADAMQHAHDMGVVHRDLKPSNVLVDAQGRARVLDFGLARREGSESLTVSGDVLGTPGYMSPEQAEGNRAASGAPAVDVFGVGAVLYFMLTGRAPFTGDSASEVLRRAADGVVTPPRTVNGQTPRALETVCLKCLRRAPGERYASAGEVAADLRRFLADESVLAQPVSVFRRGRDWLRRRPRTAAVLLILAAALVAGGLWLRHHWLYVREQEIVCVWAVRTVQGMEPVRVLSADEWQRRTVSTRLIRRGSRGPVVRYESIAGDGRVIPGGISAPFFEIASALPRQKLPLRAVLAYDDAGRVSEETLYDSTGGVAGRTRWIYPIGESAARTARVDYFDAAAAPLTGGTAAFSGRVHADARGEWVRVEFLDASGQPATADRGVYGRRMTREGGGLSNEVIYLDRDAHPMNNAEGVARVVETFSGDLRRKETRTFDASGRPVLRYGYHLAVEINDVAGATLERTHFKEDGTTAAHSLRPSERGAAKVSYRYGENGRIASITASGFAAGTGFAVKRETWTWPDAGGVLYAARTGFFDASGNPVRYQSGYLHAWTDYDAFRRPLRFGYDGFDPAVEGYWGETAVNTWGDSLRPDRVTWTYRNEDGTPARSPKGHLQAVEEYDARDRLLRITRTGYDGRVGYVKRVITVRYDSDTGTTETGRENAYFDEAGRSVEPNVGG